jgi:hypothetical protein
MPDPVLKPARIGSTTLRVPSDEKKTDIIPYPTVGIANVKKINIMGNASF